MPRKKRADDTSAPLFDAKTTTAPCVPAIRDKVADWRAADYPGATDTTRLLLNHWFLTDHRLPNGRKFAYHYSQRQDLQCYTRGEAERAGSLGALYVTNVQQLYDRPAAEAEEPDEMTAVLGPRPPARTTEVEDFVPRLVARGGPVAVLNDEAHHTHDEESEWNKMIRRLHVALRAGGVSPLISQGNQGADAPRSPGIAAQLDFTATPRHTKGQLFSWTVYDYPLKQAILDNIVKRPLKGIAKGIQEQKSEIASTRYQAYLAAGVERWKEYRDGLAPLGRKPLLFVSCCPKSPAFQPCSGKCAGPLRPAAPRDRTDGKSLALTPGRSVR